MKELSKKVYARMTSHANYSQMNGIEKEWFLKCIEDGLIEAQQQVNSVDLANVVVALPSNEFLDEAAINFCKEHYPDYTDVTKETEVFDAGAIWMRKRLVGQSEQLAHCTEDHHNARRFFGGEKQCGKCGHPLR